jgi:2-polyprenyl-3-methyl-5-hydroxy-6-metoxy-1,4-benzoquinol methylase
MFMHRKNALLVEQLSREFNAPEPFVRLYLETQFPGCSPSQSSAAWLNGLSDLTRLHASYALSTNQRATETVEQISHVSAGVKRYLDVGCAYGGLVREFACRGVESTGIEIDPTLVRYALANTRDVGATIVGNSILALDPDDLGTFDLITCVEVIEHIENPVALIQLFARLLNDGGALFLRAPNGRCIDAVTSDGHFQQFGIVLLSREEARVFKDEVTGVLDTYEHMGEYFPLDYYMFHLANVGIQPECQPYAFSPAELLSKVPEKLARLANAYRVFSESHPRLSFFRKEMMIRKHAAYCRDFYGAYERALAGQDAPTFIRDFLHEFWTIVGRKSSSTRT